jgi:hypothetical protein
MGGKVGADEPGAASNEYVMRTPVSRIPHLRYLLTTPWMPEPA